MPKPSAQKIVRMGIGEAINRLFRINHLLTTLSSYPREDLSRERALLIQALDHYPLEIAFDCDGDDVPDTVEIFERTAQTSCCRVMPFKSERAKRAPTRRTASGSRSAVRAPGRAP